MSSSSSGDGPARRLLAAAFGALHDEAPWHHRALCEALAGLTVHVAAGGEWLAPRVDGGRLAVAAPGGSPRVTIRTTLAAVLGLLDARHTVIEAVARGELDARGSADALDAAADAFATFLHGMVRAPSSARLLDELRQVVRSDPGDRS